MQLSDFSLESHRYDPCERLVALPRSDSTWSIVENLFIQNWKHSNKPTPHVRFIFKVLSPQKSLDSYCQYLSNIACSKLADTEQLLFHGTNRLCAIAEDSDRTCPCLLPDCSLCSIIRNSYDISKCGTKHKFRRFGSGIYTTSCSSKADDYSSNGSNECQLRVLLLNHVVVGRPLKRLYNCTYFTQPPFGYHSVVGTPGRDLNYPETVVYNNDAVRPAFVVVYGDSPPTTATSKLRAMISALFNTPLVS